MTKTGPGTLMLTAPTNYTLTPGGNSFSGGLFINQGTLFIGNQNTGTPLADLGASTITFSGTSTLQFTGNPEPIGSTPGPSFTIGSGVTATFDDNTAQGSSNGGWYFPSHIKGEGALNFISSVGNTDTADVSFQAGGEGAFYLHHGGQFYNWTYTGPTTIYSTSVSLDFESGDNGVPLNTMLNPHTVLNLGGTLYLSVDAGPGASAPFQNVATFINLIAGTSSQIVNSAMPPSAMMYLNTVGSNGIVRASGSTLEIDPTTLVYVANGAVANSNGIIGGWATAGTLQQAFGETFSIPGTDWARRQRHRGHRPARHGRLRRQLYQRCLGRGQ